MSRRKYRDLVAYDVTVTIVDDPMGKGRSDLELLREAVAECGGELTDVRPRIVRVPLEDDEGEGEDEDVELEVEMNGQKPTGTVRSRGQARAKAAAAAEPEPEPDLPF